GLLVHDERLQDQAMDALLCPPRAPATASPPPAGRPWTAASDSAPTDAAGPGLSGTATLRALRRSGQLGTLSEAAQSMLLTGPLFAYGDAEAEPMSPHQATPGFRCGSAESDRQRLSW
ncbi:unnamed protein product, partial [Polarella glacialis]